MNFETVIKALVEFSFSFTNSWMLAYFAWKLYICGKKLKKRRILWWTWISPAWPAYPGDEIAVSIKLLLRWYWDQGSPPDLPMIPGCCCDLNPGTDTVEKYPHRYEQDTQIWRRYTNINADMSQLIPDSYWRPHITAGKLRSYQAILVITIHCNIEGKGSLLRFLIFYYSHSLTGMAPIELYAVSSPHILPSIVRSIIEHSGNIPNIRCSEK